MMEECRRMRDKMKDRNSKQQEKAVVGRGGGDGRVAVCEV